MKVVYKAPNFIALAKEFNGDANGLIYNESRIKGAEKAMKKYTVETNGSSSPSESNFTVGECPTGGPECKDANKDFKPVAELTKQQKINKAGKWIFGLSAAALLVYSIYSYSKQKTN